MSTAPECRGASIGLPDLQLIPASTAAGKECADAPRRLRVAIGLEQQLALKGEAVGERQPLALSKRALGAPERRRTEPRHARGEGESVLECMAGRHDLGDEAPALGGRSVELVTRQDVRAAR
jgi:hypothetical protein